MRRRYCFYHVNTKSNARAEGHRGCCDLRGFLVVTLIAGRKGPVPAVLKALTVKKYCVSAAKPLTVTDVWFQGTLTFPMVSGFVSSSQYTTCSRQRACHWGFNSDILFGIGAKCDIQHE